MAALQARKECGDYRPNVGCVGESVKEIRMCIQIGLLCCQADPVLRPAMRGVAVLLLQMPESLEESQKFTRIKV